MARGIAVDGGRVKRYRAARALSVRELSRKAEVSQGTVSRMERGEPTTPDVITKVAKVLDVEPELLAAYAEGGPDIEAVLLAMIEGREARLQEAVDKDEIGLETAKSADDLHRDISEMVPRLRTGRERINLALDGLKATVDASYDAAVRRLTGRRASVETINTQAEGGRTEREVRSA